jgi:hypothetical protein
MRRGLIFRVWDEVNKKFYSQEVLNALPLEVFLASPYIQQYTGMNDKKGRPIFEGDIINGMMDYGPGGFVERTSSVYWDNYSGYQWNFWNLSTIKIVGNIFEPPCKPDHNGECLFCDSIISECEYKIRE